MSGAMLSAFKNLVQALLDAGALSDDDIIRAADRIDREGSRQPDDEREQYEAAAHALRCAILYAACPDEPERPRLDVIDGGKSNAT